MGRLKTGVLAATVLLLAGIAAVLLESASDDAVLAESHKASTSEAGEVDPTGAPLTVDSISVERAPSEIRAFEIAVVDEQGRGVPGASLVCGEPRQHGDVGTQHDWTTGTAVLEQILTPETNGVGAFLLGADPVPGTIFGVFASGYYFKGGQIQWGEGRQSVTLRPTSPLRVRVLDERGGPASGVQIVVRSSLAEAWQTRSDPVASAHRLYRYEAVTDGAGETLIDCTLDSPMAVFALMPNGSTGAVDWNVGAGEICELRLASRKSILVQVTDANGQSLAGADVAVFSGGFDADSLVDAKRSDSSGMCEVALPIGAASQFVYAFHSGYQPELLAIRASEMRALDRLEVALSESKTERVRIVDAQARPMANLAVTVEHPSGAWDPISRSTNIDGFVEPELSLPSSGEIYLRLANGGSDLGQLSVSRNGAGTQEIAIPTVGRFASVNAEAGSGVELETLELLGSRGSSGGIATWIPGTQCPYVQAGACTVVAYWSDGSVSEIETTVKSEVDEVLRLSLDRVPVTLTCSDQDLLGALLEVLTSTGAFVTELTVAEAPTSLELSPGRYVFRVQSAREGWASSYTTEVRAPGLDVDLADQFHELAISGLVIDQEGFAVSGAEVQLLRADGFYCGLVTTDEQGAFEISGLREGHYTLEVFLESMGFVDSSIVREHFLAGTALRSSVLVQVGTARGQLEIAGVGIPQGFRCHGFAVSRNECFMSPVRSGGVARIPVSGAIDDIGLAGGKQSALVLVRQPSVAGSKQMIDMRGIPSFRIRVVDERGAAVAGVLVQPVFGGRSIAGVHAITDIDGEILVWSTNSGSQWIRLIPPAGGEVLVLLEDALASREISLAVPSFAIAVRDKDGGAVKGAFVSRSIGSDAVRTGTDGVAIVRSGSSQLWVVSKPGYWPTTVRADEGTVLLRRACRKIRMAGIPEAVASLSLVPTFSLTGVMEIPGASVRDGEAEAWEFPVHPEGEYIVSGADSEGNEVLRMATYLAP